MYKGQLEGFPSEIVNKMLYYQVKQGNPRDISVFEGSSDSDKDYDGFDWSITEEGDDFWSDIIQYKKFNIFFEKYPNTNPYPKVMRISDSPINEKNKGERRVVFMEKCGKFLAWSGAETIKGAEDIVVVHNWLYAKDIEEPEQVKKMTVAEISKLVGCKVEIVE